MKLVCIAVVIVASSLTPLAGSSPLPQKFEEVRPGTRQLIKSPGHGGTNGVSFDDVMNTTINGVNITRVYSINISFSDRVDAIQVTYLLSNGSLYQTPSRGSNSNPPFHILFDFEEHITKIEGETNGTFINKLTITTAGTDYKHTEYGPFGSNGTIPFTLEGYIMGFHGRSDDVLDNIGVYSLEPLKKSQEYGGSGGNPFDDRVDGRVPPIIGISRLFIWHHNIVSAIQVEYRQLGDGTLLGDKHGGKNNQNLTTITFDRGEQMKEIRGQIGESPKFIHQLTFITRKEGGGNAQYGPFGLPGQESFSLVGDIYGLIGSSGTQVDRIGVYYL